VTDTAYLISRSCTTGWLDWVHGELWLLPHGLVRSSIGLDGTVANRRRNGIGRTVPDPLPYLPVAAFDHEQIRAAHRTNKVLPYNQVAAAMLFRGRTAHGLKLTMTDGRRHKLLWLTRDPAHAVLSETLPAVLQDRLSHR
jgi:hypothetical protein